MYPKAGSLRAAVMVRAEVMQAEGPKTPRVLGEVKPNSEWWRGDAGANSADLRTGEAHPIGVGTARGSQFIGEAIHGIEDVACAFAFATVAAGLAVSLAGLAVTGDRI